MNSVSVTFSVPVITYRGTDKEGEVYFDSQCEDTVTKGKKERLCVAHSLKIQSIVVGKVKAAGAGKSSSYCAHSQEAEMDEC